MRMYGVISAVTMKKFANFDVDKSTGVVSSDPTYILQATVSDLDNPQSLSLYQCSLEGGFGVEGLRTACKAKAPEAERDVLAAQVEAQAKQMEGQRVELVIKRAKAKNNFLSFAVDSVQLLQVGAGA